MIYIYIYTGTYTTYCIYYKYNRQLISIQYRYCSDSKWAKTSELNLLSQKTHTCIEEKYE